MTLDASERLNDNSSQRLEPYFMNDLKTFDPAYLSGFYSDRYDVGTDETDSIAFCNKAKDYDLIFVPADNFGCPGYFRMAYCIDTEKVKRAIPVMRKFMEECYS